MPHVRGYILHKKVIINKHSTLAKNADINYSTTNSDENNILCFYTNTDQLRNEFERRTEKLKLHIIIINEV